jgi:hypothetical protein
MFRWRSKTAAIMLRLFWEYVVADEYRRQVRSRIWHWRLSCRDYPVRNFEISKTKPTTGELCTRCATEAD